MSERTPNYCLTEAHSYRCGQGYGDSKTLDAGAWVRPIELVYVPIHVKENEKWQFFNPDLEVFCYTRWGIIPIPRKLLRER